MKLIIKLIKRAMKKANTTLSYFFQCAEIREKNIFEKDPTVFNKNCPCLIKVVMFEAEDLFRQSLKSKSLKWLHDKVKRNFSCETKKSIEEWINEV